MLRAKRSRAPPFRLRHLVRVTSLWRALRAASAANIGNPADVSPQAGEGKLAVVDAVPERETQGVWSAHDVFLQHKRRYTAKSLRNALTDTSLRMERVSYFNVSLLLVVRRDDGFASPAGGGSCPEG